MIAALVLGFGLGAFVAAQVGPISLLLIRTVLREGALVGLTIGAAAALVDTIYAALGLAGAASLLRVAGVRTALAIVGAVVLCGLGARTLWAAGTRHESAQRALDPEVEGAWKPVNPAARAFTTAAVATASNPLTIISWGAIFGAATTHSTAGEAVALLAGVAAGSATWFAALTAGVVLAGRRLGARQRRAIDIGAGCGLVAFGIGLFVRSGAL